MFPESGGQYQYLKGVFTAKWSRFCLAGPCSLSFSAERSQLLPSLLPNLPECLRLHLDPNNILMSVGGLNISAAQLLAIASLFVLTWLNTRGLRTGAFIQDILTAAKGLSLGLLILLGLLVFRNSEVISLNFGNFSGMEGIASPAGFSAMLSAIGIAMVGSLFSSDAWNNVTFIAGEIDNPKRNVPLALALGVLAVTLLYLLANLSYLSVLPFYPGTEGSDILNNGIQHATQDRVGTAALMAMLGAGGAAVMAVMIMISTFGCNNGLILSGARVYHSMANDGLFFKMKELNKNGVPEFALWIQFVWCSVLCLSGKYGDLLDYVMFAVMLFYILTVAGIFIPGKKT
jgi:APA family basic amino acid/polyamine antiporter